MGLSGVPPDRLAAWVRASCEAQGIKVRVSDPSTVRQVVALLGGPGDGRGDQRLGAVPRREPGRSAASPAGHDPVNVQATSSLGPGEDAGVVEHGGDDGVLTVEVQRGPLGAQGVAGG